MSESQQPSAPSFIDLIKQGVVNPSTGCVRIEGKSSPSTTQDLLSTNMMAIGPPVEQFGYSLSDLIDDDMVGLAQSSPDFPPQVRIRDKFSGDLISMDEAIRKRVLNPSATEVFAPSSGNWVNVKEALESRVIDEDNGVWNGDVPLIEARKELLVIGKPLSLRDVVMKGLTTVGTEKVGEREEKVVRIIDPIADKQLTIIEGVKSGFLDPFAKTVKHPVRNEVVNVEEALVTGLLSPAGFLRDERSNELLSLDEATAKGLLLSVEKVSIFDIPCVRSSKDDEFISLGKAMDDKLIDGNTATICKLAAKEKLNLSDAIAAELVNSTVGSVLCEGSGFYEKLKSPKKKKKGGKDEKKELNVFEAVVKRKMLPSGEGENLRTGEFEPIDVLVKEGNLDAQKANMLKSLYNITLTTGTIQTTTRHRITVQSEETRSEFRNVDSTGSYRVSTEEEPIVEMVSKKVPEQNIDSEFSRDSDVPPVVLEKAPVKIEQQSMKETLRYSERVTKTTHFVSSDSGSPEKVTSTGFVEVPVSSKGGESNVTLLASEFNTPEMKTPVRTVQETISQQAKPKVPAKLPEKQPEELIASILEGKMNPAVVKIQDPVTKSQISFEEAIEKGIIDPNMKEVKVPEGEKMSLTDAVKLGALGIIAAPLIGTKAIVDKIKSTKTAKPTKAKVFVQVSDIPSSINEYFVPKDDSKGAITVGSDIKTPKTISKDEDTKNDVSGSKIEVSFGNKEQRKESPIASLDRESLSLTENGWPLKEAIEVHKFDPVSGMLTIKGTDRLVSFEECVFLKIIDPLSACVVDPSNKSRKMSLERALENNTLDSTGNYTSPTENCNMKTALDKKLICFLSPGEKPCGASSLSEGEYETKLEESVQKPKTSQKKELLTLEQKEELKDLREGKMDPQKIVLKDPKTRKELTYAQAVKKGILDPNKGVVKFPSRKPMNLTNAFKMGALAIMAAPILGAQALASKIETPRTKPMKAAKTFKNTDEIPASMQEYFIRKDPGIEENTVIIEEVIPIDSFYTTEITTTTTTVILTKVSRMVVPPGNLIEAGVIDAETADVLSDPNNLMSTSNEQMTLSESISSGKIDGDTGAILDPKTQELMTISQAVVKEVLDQKGNILLPVARSLSVPELETQGLYDLKAKKVIHPETGEHMKILEAVASDVLNPISPVVHPDSKKKMTLTEAVAAKLVDDDTGDLVTEGGNVPMLEAVKEGLYEECSHPLKSYLPPVGLTLQAAIVRGLVDKEDGTLKNPCTGDTTPVVDAFRQGILMHLPTPVGESKKVETAKPSTTLEEKVGEIKGSKKESIIIADQTKDTVLKSDGKTIPIAKKAEEQSNAPEAKYKDNESISKDLASKEKVIETTVVTTSTEVPEEESSKTDLRTSEPKANIPKTISEVSKSTVSKKLPEEQFSPSQKKETQSSKKPVPEKMSQPPIDDKKLKEPSGSHSEDTESQLKKSTPQKLPQPSETYKTEEKAHLPVKEKDISPRKKTPTEKPADTPKPVEIPASTIPTQEIISHPSEDLPKSVKTSDFPPQKAAEAQSVTKLLTDPTDSPISKEQRVSKTKQKESPQKKTVPEKKTAEIPSEKLVQPEEKPKEQYKRETTLPSKMTMPEKEIEELSIQESQGSPKSQETQKLESEKGTPFTPTFIVDKSLPKPEISSVEMESQKGMVAKEIASEIVEPKITPHSVPKVEEVKPLEGVTTKMDSKSSMVTQSEVGDRSNEGEVVPKSGMMGPSWKPGMPVTPEARVRSTYLWSASYGFLLVREVVCGQ